MSNHQAIISVVDKADLPNLFLAIDEDKQSKLFPIIEYIEKSARSIVLDVNTNEGKKDIKSLAFSIAKAKTAIENAGKEKKAELSVDIKIIDEIRNISKSRLQELQDEIRQPLTELENKEKQRKADIESRLERLSSAGNAAMNSDQLLELIASITSQPIDDSWDEYKADAIEAHESTLTRLKATYQQVKQAEDERAELEALRAEAAESRKREAERQAADQARAEAEAKAERQAEQMRQEHQRQLDMQKQAIEQAKIEHQRQLDEQAQKAEQERQRLEDERNRLIVEERRASEARRKDLEAQAEKERLEAEQLKKNQQLKDQASNALYEDLIANKIPKTHASKIVKLVLDDKLASWADLAQFV